MNISTATHAEETGVLGTRRMLRTTGPSERDRIWALIATHVLVALFLGVGVHTEPEKEEGRATHTHTHLAK